MILPNLTKPGSNNKVMELLNKIFDAEKATREELTFILDNIQEDDANHLFLLGRKKACIHYGDTVFMRSLIEFSNYCDKTCLYCGLNCTNSELERYRMSLEEIMEACEVGHSLGYKTFVLQSGEDSYYTDEKVCEILKAIKAKYPECAITLSIGEKEKESYQKFKDAGCDRYLLRHEAANKELYEKLHTPEMKYETRMQCLQDIKNVGLQVGAGFMVHSPGQTNECLVDDLMFLQDFQPAMCGIGPYICHSKTPLAGNESGTSTETAVMVALTRLLVPKALLPAATALGTVDNVGREKILAAGGNVVMPKVTPTDNRVKYELYENMICLDDAPQDCRYCIQRRIESVNLKVDLDRGDNVDFRGKK